ncbi:MAG: alpha/beta hydrolase-fold protein [Saprospiraceae bacterium]
MIKTQFVFLLLLSLVLNTAIAQELKHGSLVTEKLNSVVLRENRTGLDPNRTIKIYLPPGYERTAKSYPVVYYLHNFFWSAEKAFEDGKLIKLLDRGFTDEVVKEFIFVAADFSTPTTGSIYENSPVSGRWLDFIVGELLPFIDGKFRTIRHRDSRALVGDFFGGRGALKLAMIHADLFSVSYAMHPVATGTGYTPLNKVQVDWKKIHQASSIAEIENGTTKLFVTICQAFLPNLNRPPFYCDYFMEPDQGELKVHVENTRKGYFDQFLLIDSLDEAAVNLKSMRGLAFDWARFDPNQSHVYSNQAFSRKLEDLGIEHEAEEYRGDPWNQNWTDNGRFYSRVLPFLNRHLIFENPK